MTYVYSAVDSRLPADAHDAAIRSISALPDGVIYDAGITRHVVSAGHLPSARMLAAYLLDVSPITGDTGDTGS